MIIEKMMEWYNVLGELEDDDMREVHIVEFEGIWELDAPRILSDKILNPLKIKKVNVGTPENTKFANISDY